MISAVRLLCSVALGIAVCFEAVFCQAIPRLTISGKVVDDSTGAPLENVNVFLAHTTFGSNTDQQGRFEIRNVPEATYDLTASRIGYKVRSIQLFLTQAHPASMDISLRPAALSVAEVMVTGSKPGAWQKQLDKFRQFFLGTTPNSKQCRIINPEVLDFNDEGEAFVATARRPLEIENEALGYHVRFVLTLFRVEPEVLVYEVYPLYSEMTPISLEQKEQWVRNRIRAFHGSRRHFLACLVNGSWKKEGYVLNLMPFVNTQDTPNLRTRLSPANIDLILSATASEEYKYLRYNDVLEVEYTRERLDPGYNMIRKAGTDAQVSWLQLNHESITVSSLGLTKEPFPMKTSGYWAWLRLADSLPLDYEPQE